MNNLDRVFQNVDKKYSGRSSNERPNFGDIFGNIPQRRPKVELSSSIQLKDFKKIG